MPGFATRCVAYRAARLTTLHLCISLRRAVVSFLDVPDIEAPHQTSWEKNYRNCSFVTCRVTFGVPFRLRECCGRPIQKIAHANVSNRPLNCLRRLLTCEPRVDSLPVPESTRMLAAVRATAVLYASSEGVQPISPWPEIPHKIWPPQSLCVQSDRYMSRWR